MAGGSLRSRLLALVALSLLPPLALVVHGGLSDRRRAIAKAGADLEALAALAARDQRDAVRDAQRLVETLANVDVVREGRWEECSALLARLKLSQEAELPYSNIGVITPDGILRASALPFEPGTDLSDRWYFQETLRRRGFTVGRFQLGKVTKRYQINVAGPVLDAAGEVRSVVFAAIALDDLRGVLRRTSERAPWHAGAGGTLTVLDAEGRVLFALPPAPDREWKAHPVPAVAASLGVAGPGRLEAEGGGGSVHLFAWAPVGEWQGATRVIAEVPLREVVADADRRLAASLAAMLAAGALALAAAWFFADLLVARRVRRLAEAAERIGRGDFTTRIPGGGGGGEIGALENSVNAMAASLERLEREREEAAGRVREIEERHRQAQKMEAVGRLASAVAHDFANVLTAILGHAGLARDRAAADPEAVGALDDVEAAARRGSDLVRRLLDFGRPSAEAREDLDLNEAVRDAGRLVGGLLPPGVRLETDLAADLGRVRADRAQMDQVLVNLVVNARDAMPRGGRVRIETRNVDVGEGEAPGHPAGRAGRFVQLAVRDEGTGMDEDVRRRVFEPFFTTKEDGGGTGLGLATVYGIVTGFGGAVWCESEPGHGTAFHVLLPRIGSPGA